MRAEDDLRGVSEEEYGEQHQLHLLEQYKMYVEMTDRISKRRQSANSFFLALNSAVVALVGYVQVGSPVERPVFYAFVGMAGIAISYLWFRMICSYRNLNAGKFEVIHDIELCLPVRPFTSEWKSIGEGRRPDLFLPFTRIEVWIPWVFIVIYAFVILRVVF